MASRLSRESRKRLIRKRETLAERDQREAHEECEFECTCYEGFSGDSLVRY